MAIDWVAAAGASAAATAGVANTVLSGRSSRKTREHNATMWSLSSLDNDRKAKEAWQRETDIQYQMEQYKNAGINPYMVTGQQFNAPTSASADYKTADKPDYSGISHAGQSLSTIGMQSQLINAQVRNIEADTRNKELAGEAASAELPYKAQTAASNVEHLQESIKLLQQQTTSEKAKQSLMALQNLSQALSNQYQEEQTKLEIETKTQSNRESQQRIAMSKKEMSQLDIVASKISTEIDKLKQDIETGKLTQVEIDARTRSIIEKLPEELKALQRSNQGLLTPLKGLQQEIFQNNRDPKGIRKIDSMYHKSYRKY